jgi:hypothetical protein
MMPGLQQYNLFGVFVLQVSWLSCEFIVQNIVLLTAVKLFGSPISKQKAVIVPLFRYDNL